jgi:hypothetical protein
VLASSDPADKAPAVNRFRLVRRILGFLRFV